MSPGGSPSDTTVTTCCMDNCGRYIHKRAATPVTCGVAMEVPCDATRRQTLGPRKVGEIGAGCLILALQSEHARTNPQGTCRPSTRCQTNTRNRTTHSSYNGPDQSRSTCWSALTFIGVALHFLRSLVTRCRGSNVERNRACGNCPSRCVARSRMSTLQGGVAHAAHGMRPTMTTKRKKTKKCVPGASTDGISIKGVARASSENGRPEFPPKMG